MAYTSAYDLEADRIIAKREKNEMDMAYTSAYDLEADRINAKREKKAEKATERVINVARHKQQQQPPPAIPVKNIPNSEPAATMPGVISLTKADGSTYYRGPDGRITQSGQPAATSEAAGQNLDAGTTSQLSMPKPPESVLRLKPPDPVNTYPFGVLLRDVKLGTPPSEPSAGQPQPSKSELPTGALNPYEAANAQRIKAIQDMAGAFQDPNISNLMGFAPGALGGLTKNMAAYGEGNIRANQAQNILGARERAQALLTNRIWARARASSEDDTFPQPVDPLLEAEVTTRATTPATNPPVQSASISTDKGYGGAGQGSSLWNNYHKSKTTNEENVH